MYEDSLGAPPQIFRKIHWNILPLLCTIAALCYIDRTNLAFASLQLSHDLKFTPDVYGLGSGLFFLGYALFMIPSNLLLMKLGAPTWLGTLIIVWGAVATSFCTLTSARQFCILRLLLGMAEAGAFPGMWFYMYQFYPADKMTFPMSVLEAAVAVANVLSAPLAASLLLLDGQHGLRGWQWLFLLEGGPTIAIGCLTLLVLPRNLQQATFLNGAEKRWLVQSLEQRSRIAMEAEAFSSGKIFLEAISNFKVWYVSIMGLLKNVASSGLLFWCPILVVEILQGQSFGPNSRALKLHEAAHSTVTGALQSNGTHSGTLAVLLTGIPFIIAAVFAIWLGRHSQKQNEKSYHLAVPYLTSAILLASFPRLSSWSSVLAFIILSIVIAALQGANSIINSFIPVVSSGASVSVSLALYNSIANIGGLLGPLMIGQVVHRTGSYGDAIKLLGIVVGFAAIMALQTQKWSKSDKEGDHDSHDMSISKLLEEPDL